MKSKINHLADYREAPFEKEHEIGVSEDFIKGQIRHLTRSGKKTVTPETIEKGDVAVLSLKSGLEKFNRPTVFVTCGGGLFDAEFEAQMIGHRSGETYTATVQGEPVETTVKNISRTIFPEPTDAMAEAYCKTQDGFEGITTLQGYIDKITQDELSEQRTKIVYEIVESIMDYVLEHSDFEFDEDELKAHDEETMKEITEQLQEQKKDLETLSSEEMETLFGVGNIDELKKFVHSQNEWMIAETLWAMDHYQLKSEDELDFYAWDFLADHVKENIHFTETKEA